MPLPAPPARIRSTSLLHVCSHNCMRRSVLVGVALVAFLATARTRLLGACSGAASQHRALRYNIARCVQPRSVLASRTRLLGALGIVALQARHCARQRAQTNYGRVGHLSRVGCRAAWDAMPCGMGQLCLNTRPMDRSEHWIFKQFAEMALESVPENAVIIAQVRNPASSACTPYCDYQCLYLLLRLCMVLVCVRACVPQRVRACMRACVCACARGQSDSCGRATSTSTL
jgi:hypothetical protein